MIEVTHTLANCDRLAAWLERTIRPQLRPDVSNYAKSRLRAWLRTEPPLSAPRDAVPGVPVADRLWDRLAELIEWRFDYCLVTYSGDEQPIGITPHRDAGFANYEARNLHLTGECKFDYWLDYPEFRYTTREGRTPYQVNPRTGKVTLHGKVVEPTHNLIMQPGNVVIFNAKNPHAASPSSKRWNLNFWRRK